MMKKTLLLAAILASFAFVPSAYACTPVATWPPSASENLAMHSTAFVGTVTSIAQDKSVNGDYRITFKVEKAIKGTLGDAVTVITRSSSAACGYNDGYTSFKEGSVWAIYANGDSTDGYSTNSLSLNKSYGSVSGAIADTEQQGSATALPAQDLSFGMTGTDVATLQAFLIHMHAGVASEALARVGATGYYGQLTRAALAEFQTTHGIAPAQGYYGPKTRAFMNAMAPVHAPTFSGTISAAETGCFADGVCSVTVDGKKVVLLSGFRVSPVPAVGSLKGVDSIGDLEAKIGSTADVYAAPVTDGSADYTLYGDASYYVLVR